MCGGPEDAVALGFGGTCEVLTNDVSSRLSPAHPGKQPDWVVTSPPYKGAVGFVKAVLAVAAKGVALRLPLSFRKPCADRGSWLVDNPPVMCGFLRRAKYTHAHHVKVGEFWGVWYTDGGCGKSGGSRLVFCPE
ncbi:unnamed protein product [Ectocarpus sp. CCAP 1310/34]|nr:unnamed protein product [Ectocarpus sp. CCAP 1310/34]